MELHPRAITFFFDHVGNNYGIAISTNSLLVEYLRWRSRRNRRLVQPQTVNEGYHLNMGKRYQNLVFIPDQPSQDFIFGHLSPRFHPTKNPTEP
jgi:hypothetical protein